MHNIYVESLAQVNCSLSDTIRPNIWISAFDVRSNECGCYGLTSRICSLMHETFQLAFEFISDGVHFIPSIAKLFRFATVTQITVLSFSRYAFEHIKNGEWCIFTNHLARVFVLLRSIIFESARVFLLQHSLEPLSFFLRSSPSKC